MRFLRLKEKFSVLGRLALLATCIAIPVPTYANGELLISEGPAGQIRIEVAGSALDTACAAKNGQLFSERLGIKKLNDGVYLQPLNSVVEDDANYLKAARMGGGVYMHLPYFVPAGKCKDAIFEVRARRILWNGKWYNGAIKISVGEVRQKSIFFTNEDAPQVKGASYFDASIPAATRVRLEADFSRIVDFYQDVLGVYPLDDIGIVVAIVRNHGGYSGFGGDSLNIIRISYDNPTLKDLATFDWVITATFTHELAHKLQSERIFLNPLGRQIAEGSADFIKIVILRNAGLIDEAEAKRRILSSAAKCAALADSRSLVEKVRSGGVNYREPYDCGMVYYFVSYYSSGYSGTEYLQVLQRALSGDVDYSQEKASMCMLFEPECSNNRLKGIVGNKEQYLQQIDWLAAQLDARPFPSLERRK
ncbi:hypothetical protein IV454_05630 [Massilia antarctica]|uniref:DUF4932 domain-containing protein n=1 Tax=Massilia antarctica TaxID=2765360 RepID=A0AA49A8Y7_9BURK|nr:hypothetical protein [Massilia antarctica]QPI51033.1 hypothetical protein IV454_05630 [Massilia antarctica]